MKKSEIKRVEALFFSACKSQTTIARLNARTKLEDMAMNKDISLGFLLSSAGCPIEAYFATRPAGH